MVVSSIVGVGIFIMRVIEETEDTGDKLSMWLKIIPSYAFTNGILYSGNKEILNKTREYSEGA